MLSIGERLLHRDSFERRRNDYGKEVVRIEEPVSFDDMLKGGPCPSCQGSTEKVYISWGFPSDMDEHNFKVVVENTPGYQCACGCNMSWPSNVGLVQAIDVALPVFKERKFGQSVYNLKWTRDVITEVILPEQERFRQLISSS